MDWLASPHGHIATNIVEYPLLLMLSVGEREGEGDGEDIFGLHDETGLWKTEYESTKL